MQLVLRARFEKAKGDGLLNYPALMRLDAMGAPMIPSPRNPTFPWNSAVVLVRVVWDVRGGDNRISHHVRLRPACLSRGMRGWWAEPACSLCRAGPSGWLTAAHRYPGPR